MNSKLFERNVKATAKPYKVRPVPINQTRPASAGVGQRTRLSQAHVDHLASNMDLNSIGHPCVNLRDGVFWIFDGQHRIEALKKLGFENDNLDCRVYEDLTDTEMAAMFLRVNDSKPVDPYSKFMNSVSAGLKAECDVKRVVEACKLRFSRERKDGSIGAVASCLTVYRGQGEVVLGRALRILRDAYDGDAKAFDANAIVAMGLVIGRFNGRVQDAKMVEALEPLKQGVVGIIRSADQTRLRIGAQRVLCVAATLVETYNKVLKPSERLPSWWQE